MGLHYIIRVVSLDTTTFFGPFTYEDAGAYADDVIAATENDAYVEFVNVP